MSSSTLMSGSVVVVVVLVVVVSVAESESESEGVAGGLVGVMFPSTSACDCGVAFRTPLSRSIASITFSSNPFTSLFLRHGSTATWKIRKRSTFTPISPHVPHVLIRRILSDQICSSWYRARILLLSFAAASSASRSAVPRASCASVSVRSLAWSER